MTQIGGLSTLLDKDRFERLCMDTASALASKHRMIARRAPELGLCHEVWSTWVRHHRRVDGIFSLKSYLQALDQLIWMLSFHNCVAFEFADTPSISPQIRFVRENANIYNALLMGSSLLRLEFERLRAPDELLSHCSIGHSVLEDATRRIAAKPSLGRRFRTLLGFTKKFKCFVAAQRH